MLLTTVNCLSTMIFTICLLLIGNGTCALAPTDDILDTKFSSLKKLPGTDNKQALFRLTNKSTKDIDDIIVSLELANAYGERMSFIAISDLNPGSIWLKAENSREVSFPLDAYSDALRLMETQPTSAILKVTINKIVFANENSPKPDNTNTEVIAITKTPAGKKQNTEIIYDPIFEKICEYGHPILVTGWSLDKTTRFVHFKNPEYEKNKERQTPYFYIALNGEDGITTQLGYSDLAQYKEDKIYNDDLKKLTSIPIIVDGVVRNEDYIASLFGKWDYQHKRKNGYRVIFEKPFCFQQKLHLGFLYEMENSKMIKTKGFTNRKNLITSIHDYRTYTGTKSYFNERTHHYGDEPQLKDGPVDSLLDFVLFKELGEAEEARKLISYEQMHIHNNNFYIQSEFGVEIDTKTLTYKVINHAPDSVNVLVVYSLKNGKPVNEIYEVKLIEGKWRINKKHPSTPVITS